ncbi:hypothetical protein VNO80_35207 [Phaseolus coccineus]|uniref:Uncharacterized protein n=1 Tax=Phaseolus coccineus TaxID=3886 RepID=A0AAN9Q8M9_PHACN
MTSQQDINALSQPISEDSIFPFLRSAYELFFIRLLSYRPERQPNEKSLSPPQLRPKAWRCQGLKKWELQYSLSSFLEPHGVLSIPLSHFCRYKCAPPLCAERRGCSGLSPLLSYCFLFSISHLGLIARRIDQYKGLYTYLPLNERSVDCMPGKEKELLPAV